MTATTKDGRSIEFARDEPHQRYTASVQGRVAAYTKYTPAARLVVFTHTETDPSFDGQGVASQLVRWALDDVRAQGLHVVPVCPFVKAYIGRHAAEYGDLVLAGRTTSTD